MPCPHGLPIGNLTSQFLSNVYLDGFDHFVKQELRVKGYVRYVDDFLLYGASRAEVRERGEAAREYLRGLRLEIHPDKYRALRCAAGVDCGRVLRRKKTSEARAIRGGNWNSAENNLRSSIRNNNTPTNSNNHIGFRVARPVSAPPVQQGGAPQQKLPARTAACRVQGPPGRPGCPPKSGQPKKRRPAVVSRRAKAVAGHFLRRSDLDIHVAIAPCFVAKNLARRFRLRSNSCPHEPTPVPRPPPARRPRAARRRRR